MKANKIIEMSQEKSRKKVKLAMEEIQRMRNEGERITVSGLCKRTGLSNSFFYRNEKIKETQAKCRIDIKNIVEAAQTDANSKTSEAREYAKAKIQAKKDALNVEEQNLKNTVKSTVVNDLASSITSKLLGQEVKPQSVNYEIVNKVMD